MVTLKLAITEQQMLALIASGVITSPVDGVVEMRHWTRLTPETLQQLQVCQDCHTGVITGEVITEAITAGNSNADTQLPLITENRDISLSSLVSVLPKKRARRNAAELTAEMERFEQFWAAYPRRVGKDVARRWWKAKQPDQTLLEAMLAALEWQRHSDQWAEGRGQFIPHPATWLRQGRWQDEPVARKPRQGSYIGAGATNGDAPYTTHCPHTPSCSDGRWRCIQRQQMEWMKAQGAA